ncbi:MAG: hypothetical protein EBS56_06940 [Planctomycetia bacterium]|nr:hypothetical protein [Planctomycetia bacterium]
MATVDFDRACDDDYEDHDPFAVADSEHSDVARAAGETGVMASIDQPVRRRFQKRMHRIAEVRHRQGVTLRNVARRLGLEMAVVRRQEQPDCDLRLSDVMLWQEVLEVPIAELLVEAESQLSGPVLERSRMVKLMKTAAALREQTRGTSTGRIVDMLVDQILEIMPELKDVTPWNTVGQRRTLDDLGRTATCAVPEEIFRRVPG